MSEVLPCMTAVKIACWEGLMRKRIKEARKGELRALWGQKLLDAGCVFCWAACPPLLASSTFATYALLGNKLEAPVVFTCLSLFGMLIGPMNAFPWVINGVIEAIVSVRRLVGLLSLPPGPFPHHLTTESLHSDGDVPLISPSMTGCEDHAVSLQNASFYWSDPGHLVLSDISLKVKRGQLVAVTGPVGSGKSALLLAILGELQSTSTSGQISHGSRPRYAYVSQTPWICSGTVQDNIVFGLPVDPVRLAQVVQACALGPDLATFPHGLGTDVGEAGGSRLSGGQRARIALARAVYQDADVYLLDDPLAALDVHVGEHVREHCLLGLLANKTRLITTHQSAWLETKVNSSLPLIQDQSSTARADMIVELQNGRIMNEWCPSNEPTDSPTEPKDPDAVLLFPDKPADSVQPDTTLSDCTENREAEDWERLAFGSIESSVYWAYTKSVGFWLAFGVIIFLVLMQGTRNAADWWLAYWVRLSNPSFVSPSSYWGTVTTTNFGLLTYTNLLYSAYPDEAVLTSNFTDNYRASNQSFYLTVYGSIVGANIVATTFRAVLFAIGGLAAAATIHQNALETVLHVRFLARVSYFDRTPQGRILNRFSSDVGTVDDLLPFILNVFLACVVSLVGVLVITCLSLPLLLTVLLPLAFVFWSVQRVYRGASRDLKRISSVTRSPVYAHFSDTLSGLAVIRGLGQELRFRQLTANYLGTQLRAELASVAASAWLSVRLQLVASGVIAGVVCISLLGREFGWTEVSVRVAAAGLSAAYAMNTANLMTDTVYVATETEKNLIAVERCHELTEETPVEPDTVPVTVTAPTPLRRRGPPTFRPLDLFEAHTHGIVPPDWPCSGRVEFKNISLTYRRVIPSADQFKIQALNDVTFTVEPGDRLGIVGRTGSGKSSLLRVLLRLVDHLPGPHTNAQIAQQLGFLGASGQVGISLVSCITYFLLSLLLNSVQHIGFHDIYGITLDTILMPLDLPVSFRNFFIFVQLCQLSSTHNFFLCVQVLVNGVDIRTISLVALRTYILAVSQEPFLFSGCLRDNLDPEGTLPDEELCDVLVKCQLAASPLEAVSMLTLEVGEAGRDISAGQRQLVCLARALLRQPRPGIICLDEATAAIDTKAEEAIHVSFIRSSYANHLEARNNSVDYVVRFGRRFC
ncbi:unnamed protein product [Echinostoma caproni]|uniref:ABC transporter domain-containing protein n=1 Tax=Echinostoma caproni TaxID=27848 RepID=A0A183AHC6_9TREM|nr:unnamed protein product [Echinostoma caproni]